MKRLCLALACTLLLVPRVALAVVTTDAVGTVQVHVSTAPGTYNDTSLTIGGISNGLLTVEILYQSSLTVSMTWNGVALTKTATITNSSASLIADVWTLLNPATGNKTLAVTTSGATQDFKWIARSYAGVNQSGGATSFPHTFQNTGNSNSPGGTLTSATGNYTVAVGGNTGVNPLAGASGTELFNDTQGAINGAAQEKTGAASVTLTWTNAGADQWAASGIDIAASGGGGGGGGCLSVLSLQGVGC